MATPSESPRATEEAEADVPTPDNENEQQAEGEGTMNRDDLHGYDFEVRRAVVPSETRANRAQQVKEQDRWLPIANGESLCFVPPCITLLEKR